MWYLAIHVQEDSRLAIGLEKAEQERMKEKEAMRKLTMQMADRLHVEELQQEALGMFQNVDNWHEIFFRKCKIADPESKSREGQKVRAPKSTTKRGYIVSKRRSPILEAE